MHIKNVLRIGDRVTAVLSLRTAFHVFEDSDKTEGKGGQSLRYVVDTRGEADRLAVGLGVWGRPGDVREVSEVVIHASGGASGVITLDALREDDAHNTARLAAKARAKLTPDEARALGLG